MLLTVGAWWFGLPGCYRAHGEGARPRDGSVVAEDAGLRLDAAPRWDAARWDAERPDATPPLPPHTGCRARCDPARLRAIWRGPSDGPGRIVHAVSHAGRIVVLTTRPTTGHVNPAHRLLFFDPARDSLEASDPWTGGTLRAVHHDGARIVVGPDDRIRMIALRGVAELEGVAPTGRQRVSVHLVDWNLEGEVVSDIPLISFPDEPTEMCPGGCEAAITVRGDRAVVSYAPRGRLYTVEIELGEEPVVRDWVEGPIAEPSDPLPWPHRAVIVGDERWVAGGGTLDLEPPRESWLISPGARRAIEGSMHDPPPMLLGGADAVLARYVSSRSGFVVQNLTTGEARTVVPVAGHTPPLANQLVRFPSTGRLGLVWASYAPDALRDTLVSMTPDVPSSCDAVEPTTLIRVPEGVARPSLYLHPMGTDAESFLFVMPAGPGGSDPEVAVFEVPECALVNG